MVVKAISGSTTAETITKYLVPKIIRERYPDLTEGEVEEVRQHVLLDTIVKGSDIVDDKGNPITIENNQNEEQESEGNRLIKIANRFINIDKLRPCLPMKTALRTGTLPMPCPFPTSL